MKLLYIVSKLVRVRLNFMAVTNYYSTYSKSRRNWKWARKTSVPSCRTILMSMATTWPFQTTKRCLSNVSSMSKKSWRATWISPLLSRNWARIWIRRENTTNCLKRRESFLNRWKNSPKPSRKSKTSTRRTVMRRRRILRGSVNRLMSSMWRQSCTSNTLTALWKASNRA